MHGALPAESNDRLPCGVLDILRHELSLHIGRDDAQCHCAEFTRTSHQVVAVFPDELFPIGKMLLEAIQPFASRVLDESQESTKGLEGLSTRMLKEDLPPCLEALALLWSTEPLSPLIQIGVSMGSDKTVKCSCNLPCVDIVDERILQVGLQLTACRVH